MKHEAIPGGRYRRRHSDRPAYGQETRRHYWRHFPARGSPKTSGRNDIAMPFLFLLILLIFLSLLLKTLLEYLAVAGAHWTIIMAVLTGIGYLVTAAVAYILLRRHYATALRSLRRFGKIEFQPGRLVWTLDVAALERYCH